MSEALAFMKAMADGNRLRVVYTLLERQELCVLPMPPSRDSGPSEVTGVGYSSAGPATLAMRAGASRVFGDFPFHEASFLGGASNLRGFAENSFAGDAWMRRWPAILM